MEKKVKDIGSLSGKILVFGGVYSNLQALEAIQSLAVAEGISPKNIICTGDIVAYCAQPKECITLIKDWGIHSIAGNVELNLVNGLDDCGCNFADGGRCDTFSKQWYPYLKNQLSKQDIDWMSLLPEFISFVYANKKIAVVHGSFFDTSEFIFKSTTWEIKEPNFDALAVEVILAGHCGIPFSHSNANKLWLNAGVIGMPANDGSPKVWYTTLNDLDGFESKLCNLNYDFETAAELMKNKSLPQSYRETLNTGIWDNSEILPEYEASLQGNTVEI